MSDVCAVCIIPARGGSKGIPGKNIMPIAGKPLLAWSVEHALNTPSLARRVYVTSDSDEILAVATQFGANGIKRPPELSGDTASSESALLHALDTIEKGLKREVDYVVFLQPTSPVRRHDDIELALQKVVTEGADSLLSVQPLKDYFIWGPEGDHVVSKSFDYRARKRRQELDTTYLENGSIYVFRPKILRTLNNRLGGKIVAHEMPKPFSQQIDDPEDIDLCDYFLSRYCGNERK